MSARTKTKPAPETVTLDVPLNGRDEMNLAEFPISVLADRAPRGVKTLIFRDGNGKLTVTGSDAYGLPTALDADVIVALIQLTKQKNDFTDSTVNFTRYELLRLLGWPNEGKSYRRIDEALNRWIGVSLHYDGCWWDNRSRQYGDAKIHLLESVVILDGKARIDEEDQQALPLSSFTWNKEFLKSCQADNLKRLNIEDYFSLQHPSSKRLYRFLDKRFYLRPDWLFDLKEIAFERVGLSRNYGHNVAKIKEKLQPAIDELESLGFLEPLSREERYVKDSGGWKVRLLLRHQNPPLLALEQPAPTPGSIAAERQLPDLAGALILRGVTASAAAELVRKHSDTIIQSKIEVFDWLMERKDKRVEKSPAGYLVKSITADYATPKGFVSAADRQRRAEAKAAGERQAAKQLRQEQAEKQRQAAEREKIDAYWKSLSPTAQAELQVKADAQADPSQMAKERGPFKQMGQTIRRNDYIRQLLRESSELADT